MKHATALPTHYDTQAADYDAHNNEERAFALNQVVERILKQHSIRTVLDATCGTGSQLFHLAQKGYEVTGSDISEAMLVIARKKAAAQNLSIPLHQADMTTVQLGSFDAVISMFNAIGHLSKADFEQAMYTIHTNLNDGGIYLFDICDADMLRAGDAITKLTIDWQEKLVDKTVRKIQYSTIDDDGVLASHTIYHEQALNSEPVITNHIQTLQIYSAKELEEMLERNGFETVSCELVKYHEDETERLFVIGRKK